MANGKKIIEKVQSLLKEERAIPVKTALNLTLELLVELHGIVTEQGKEIQGHNESIESLKRHSILLWIEKHPKAAVFLISLIIIMATLIDLRVVIAKALGIDL